MKKADLSTDLILSREPAQPTGLIDRIIRSVSRSIERITEPKTINYELEKLNFSKFVTQNLFSKYRRANSANPAFFSEFEENQIDALKTEKLNFLDYLRTFKARNEEQPSRPRNRDFEAFLLQKRKKIEQNLAAFKRLEKFLRASEKSLQVLSEELESRKIRAENLKFDKMKDFEGRGRTLIKIKNIEVILQVINKNDLSVPSEKTARLIEQRAELIGLLREGIDARRRLDYLRRRNAFEEEVRGLQKAVEDLNIKR